MIDLHDQHVADEDRRRGHAPAVAERPYSERGERTQTGRPSKIDADEIACAEEGGKRLAVGSRRRVGTAMPPGANCPLRHRRSEESGRAT